MNPNITGSIALAIATLSGCVSSQNGLVILDNSPSPVGAENQLELADVRGMIGHATYPKGSSAPIRYYGAMGSGSKSWVLTHWGAPDQVQVENGVEYLVYEKRSKNAPNYHLQEDGYVKLGFRHGKLVSIAAYFPNCPAYMKGPVYVLPK